MKRFERFVLDTVNQCLRRGHEVLSLTPKAFGVLRYLVDHAGRLVTKGELLEAIWPQTFVQEAVLKVCVLEIRKALGEDPKNPRYIQTLHRRGYRFIAPVAESPAMGAVTSAVLSSRLFGRSTALDHLHRVLGRASDGERQIVFVSGEPGIGKTMLVETFLEEVAGAGDIWIAAGRCVEHYGAREPYYPVLDALGRLSRQDSNPHLVQVLSKHAPTWLAQMPWLVAPDQQVSLQRDVLGATRERMLREMSEAIEILTSDQSLILALEDLHWSDVSTLDLISWLAHRRDPARLLVLGTYRPVEVIIHQHPLKSLRRELQSRGFASELALELLSDADIAAYLAARFPQNDFPPELAATIHRQTDGNPLFMVNVVDYLLARSHIADAHGHWQFQVPLANFSLEVPENLRQMIEKQIDRLSPQEQETLEIASAAGVEFSALVVSAVSGQGLPEIEDSCDRLSQRGQFLRSKGLAEFPDGSVSARYEFVHSLYRTVFYGRIPSSRRIRCHQRIGERLEASYGGRAREVATELAMHFQEGFDFARTIHYLALAAEKSASRYAHSETIELLRQALEHCERLQEPKRIDLELRLLEQTGQAYRLRGDFARAAEEFEKMAERAAGHDRIEQRTQAHLWLASALSWTNREGCLRAAATALELSTRCENPLLRASVSGQAAYWNLLFQQWREDDSQASAQALEEVRRSGHRALVALHAGRHSYFQCLSSQYRNAVATSAESLRLAMEVGSGIDYSISHFFQAWALLFQGEWGQMLKVLRDGSGMAERNGHEFWRNLFRLEEAWLHLESCSFESAQRLCAAAIAKANELQHDLSRQMGFVLMGFAYLGLGRPGEALKRFIQVREWHAEQRVLMDWIWKIPLALGLSETYLARADLSGAEREADAALELTARCSERTWQAMAHCAAGRTALARKNLPAAEQRVIAALQLLEGVEAPLAAWRVHALAADILDHSGRREEQTAHYSAGIAITQRLADSLGDNDELRSSFLACVPFREQLSRAR